MAMEIRKIGKDTEENRMLNELFVSPIRTGFLEVGEDKFVIPIYYEKYREQVDKLEVRDDDVFITGHPKTGTTWVNEMVYKVVHDLHESILNISVAKNMPFLDMPLIHDEDKLRADFPELFKVDTFTIINQAKSPRCIKTHMHWSLLPEQIRNGTKKPKIIHILRNPKDTCVSYYHSSKLMDGYIGGFEEFCRLFMAGRLNYAPFFSTILSYWHERHRPNVLILKYKDMKQNFPGAMKTAAEFLGKSFTQDQIEELVQYLSFDAMKKIAAREIDSASDKYFKFYGLTIKEGKFFRAGKEGGYTAEMTPELIKKFDEWTEKNLSGTGLTLD